MWLRPACITVAVAAPFALLWQSTAALLPQWLDPVHRTYTHGLLILALSAWLIFRARQRLALEPARASRRAVPLLAFLCLLWLVAHRAGIQIAHLALLPALAFAMVGATFGWKVAAAVAVPIGYLYFAVPIWDAINPLLQWTSVFAVRLLLRLVGIPAFFNGNTFQIPAGTFEIADGCSGLHFFIVGLAIAVLHGEVYRDPVRTRILLVLFAAALAAVTNWLRIFVIVVAGHLTDMQHALVSEEHYTFGWYMFAGAMVVFVLVARRLPLAAPDPHVPRRTEAAAADAAGGAVARLALASAVLAVVPLWNAIDRTSPAEPAAVAALPPAPAGWTATEGAAFDWAPRFHGADEEQRTQYGYGDGAVQAFAAVYFEQRQGKELVGYGNSVLGDRLSAMGRAANGAVFPWQELRARDPEGTQWLLWTGYRIDDSWHRPGIGLQLRYGLTSLVGSPVSTAIVVRARCDEDCAAARELLRRFVSEAWVRNR